MQNLNLPISVGIALATFGTLFQLLHLPFSNELNTVGLSLILIFYSIRFYLKRSKETPDILKLVLISVWAISSLLTIYFFQYQFIIRGLYFAVLFIWGSLEIRGYFTSRLTKSYKEAHRNHKVFKIAAGIMCLGILFNIMHWPGIDVLFPVGTILGGLWAILEIYRMK